MLTLYSQQTSLKLRLKDSLRLPILYTVLLLPYFQESINISENKNFSMTSGDCNFLTKILAFTSNISFLKITLVKHIITNFSQALRRLDIAGAVIISPSKSSLLYILLQNWLVKVQLL